MIGVVLMFALAALACLAYWAYGLWKLEQWNQTGRHATLIGSHDQLTARQIKCRVEFQARYNFTEADYL